MALLAVGVQSAWGFSLLGPLANGGDSWQTATIGYGLPYTEYFAPGGPVNLGDIGGPKNIAEGYRRNTPVIYYTYDANFLNYFGSNGAAASDSAFAIMNQAFTTNPVTGQYLTNGVDSYSLSLSEYPPESLHINYEAQSLALTDLKSVTLHCLVEQLGLAEPERFTWTLAERVVPPGCPVTTEYLVVQRNFGINASALNQLQYSSYVNDTLYTYLIEEFCSGPNPLAYTLPLVVDPFADIYTAVAANNANGLGIGGYYAGLTRDDVAGLRYLLSTNNLAWETAAFIAQGGTITTSGSHSSTGNNGVGAADLLTTNSLPNQLLTTLPISLLLSQSLTNDPATLQGLYPGLTFTSVTTNFMTLSTPTVTAYYTNQPGPDVTNFGFPPQFLVTADLGLLLQRAAIDDPATLLGLYPGLLVTTVTNFGVLTLTNTVFAYTNQPGPDLTNFLSLSLTTSDLGLLLQRAAIDDPATLQGLYPGLIFTTVTNVNPVQVITTNITAYYTNQPGPDVTNLGTIQLLNPPPNSIVPPPGQLNWSGTMDFGYFSLQVATNNTGLTVNPALAIAQLQALYPGLVVLSATPYFTNVITTNFITTLTVPIGAPVGSPPVQKTTISGIFTNYEVQYTYTFGNLMLDSNGTFYPFVDYNTSRSLYNTNVNVTIQTIAVTNLTGAPVGSPQMTNTTTVTARIPGISGDFFILPTNWCGFTIVQPLNVTKLDSYVYQVIAVSTTNNIPGNITNGTAQWIQNTIYSYTNRQFIVAPGICQPVLQFTTNYTTNFITTYQNTLLNVYTNNYFPTSLETVLTTNVFTTNGAPVGTLFTNGTATNITLSLPAGDFFFIPTNWCGFTIVATQLTTVVYSTNAVTNLTAQTFSAPGLSNGVLVSYSQTVITSFTNHTLLIHEGVCEPVLTNYVTYTSTNVLTYQNTLLNVVTLNSNGTSFVTLITTNIFTTNGAPVGTLVTNNPQVSFFTNVPTGDFFILPTNWCGYRIVATNQPTVITTTNTVFATIPPGVPNIGQQFSLTTISEFTNHTLVIQPGVCEPLLQFGTNYTTNIVVQYQYNFGNVVTNSYSATSLVTILATNVYVVPGSNTVTLATNVVPTNMMANIPTGDFFVIPAAWCGYSIISTQLTTVTYTTNLLTVTANTFAITGGGATFFTTGGGVVGAAANQNVSYSQTTITSGTNRTFVVKPLTCLSTPFAAGLRPGIERVQFVRANYDSLLGQFFQPITNNYTMVLITNSQATKQFFQRMVLAPDILLTAANFIAANTFDGSVTRSVMPYETDNVGAGLAGPGTINPRTTISYNKIGNAYENGFPFTALNTNRFFVYEASQMPVLQWASFDASTNDPVLYPNGTSIANLQNQILVQVTPPPPALPDGTNNAAYPATPFTASGGSFSPPYTWSLVNGLGTLPPGMTLSGTGTLSGTPTQAGTFDFTIQLTDSLGRSVNWNYTITIH
jgi:hypothetical protein